ncbi:uncharacterized protein A1O9_03783 [Exophiala aquamarina CBS 119918]|uniref:Nucleotide-diphospho-sugar transferase domain-containing protein n=1 Tax=Exophiala aquamarina CBS 119918 TaxID=1182545 RepID=A0A072PTT3_9EURO|nr:uncharacterized protein A1O9_03783 [Exophiala aquamarina CBS 119918]KEF58940.1 hypothetical protein A1O9_03783 [Exophiala aquamarina CBS 119918]
MFFFSRLPSYVGITVLFLSLIYLYQNGAIIHSNSDSNEYWTTLQQKSGDQFSQLKSQYHLRPTSSISTTVSLKPNLILSAIDGPSWQDQIFIFMQSLEIAVSEEALQRQRSNSCPAAPVQVKIIVPENLAQDLPSGFQALKQRYPSLDFVGILPEIKDVAVVLRRFQGWSDYLNQHEKQYERVLACDLDVVFQRNPFSMDMKTNVELLYFAEWAGLRIGQCSVHVGWFNQCASPETDSFVSPQQTLSYMHKNRICAGSVYGTARAIKVYMDTMASQLKVSLYRCNDQAMHIHIYYSNLLDKELRHNGVGKAELVPNDEALFGSVGTTPMVTFNEWGEMLNEKGEVQVGVHQYKTHSLLSDIVWRKFGWYAEVGQSGAIPTIARLAEEGEKVSTLEPEKQESGGADSTHTDAEHDLRHAENEKEDADATSYTQYRLLNVSESSCGKHSSLCSCKYDDCQPHYDYY